MNGTITEDDFTHDLYDREYYALRVRVYGPLEAESLKKKILNIPTLEEELRQAKFRMCDQLDHENTLNGKIHELTKKNEELLDENLKLYRENDKLKQMIEDKK